MYIANSYLVFGVGCQQEGTVWNFNPFLIYINITKWMKLFIIMKIQMNWMNKYVEWMHLDKYEGSRLTKK